MTVRTRRVRLLAVAVCIAIVFFLYERKTAAAAERYLSPGSVVGGGSVLRKEGEDNNGPPLPPPQPQPQEPIVEPKPQPKSDPDTHRDTDPLPPQQPKPTTLPTTNEDHDDVDARTTSSSSSKAPLPTLPPNVQHADDQDGYDAGSPLNDDYSVIHTSSLPVETPHWSKLLEQFPVTSTIQLPTAKPSAIPLIQSAKKGADKERLAAIKEATKHAWKGYRDIGWGFDEVSPVSGVGKNSFNGWGATLVDSLDTLWIMGMKEEFEDAVNQTSYIDFTTSSRADIPLFEVTIRYLGGLIAAYDVSGHKYRVLLDKAVELAEVLYSAFDTPNRMPETYYSWKPTLIRKAHRAGTRVVLAELGTLSLEFTRLAQLTKEPKYYDAIARITDAFEEWQNQTRIPGMWPIAVDASGCAKPVELPPSNTHHQQPFGDGYMITSEPVQADSGTVDKATSPLDKVLSRKAGSKAALDAGKSTSADDEYTDEGDSSLGNSMHSDLAEEESEDVELKKRQLDDAAEEDAGLLDPRINPDKPANVAPAVPDLTKPPFYEGEANSHTPTIAKPKQPDCVPQGLRSPSKNGVETFTMGGQSDSLYEYLPKEYLLLGGVLDQYKTMYLASMEPTIEKLLFRPMTPENLDILISGEVVSQYNYTTEEVYETQHAKGEHLTCFVGGMLAMGGKIFNRPDHVEYGRKVTEGCIWSYNATTSGIMPESFYAAPCESKTSCEWNETAYWEQLDPYKDYRQDQRADWIKQYGQEALDTYETPSPDTPRPFNQPSKPRPAQPAHRMPENLVYSDDSNSASLKQPGRHLDRDAGVDSKVKRQAVKSSDYDSDRPQAPEPAKLPVTGTKASSFADDSDAEEAVVAPPTFDTPSTTTTDDDQYQPAMAIYTPPPPPTHKEFVQQKIEDERLPAGMTRYDSRKYILRPEAIESVFYMYRITGEQHWRDAGWKMFQAVERHTRTEFGHSAIDDISKTHPEHLDGMESFWIA